MESKTKSSSSANLDVCTNRPKEDDDPTPEEELECAVCLQTCVHPVCLPCSHIFCFLCVKGVANQSKRCAMCRQEIPADFLDNPNLLKKIEEKENSTEGHQWFYEGRNGWWEYDSRTNEILEEALESNLPTVTLLIANHNYILDVVNKIQYQQKDSTKRRRMKRELKDDCAAVVKKGVAGISRSILEKSQSVAATSSCSVAATSSCSVAATSSCSIAAISSCSIAATSSCSVDPTSSCSDASTCRVPATSARRVPVTSTCSVASTCACSIASTCACSVAYTCTCSVHSVASTCTCSVAGTSICRVPPTSTCRVPSTSTCRVPSNSTCRVPATCTCRVPGTSTCSVVGTSTSRFAATCSCAASSTCRARAASNCTCRVAGTSTCGVAANCNCSVAATPTCSGTASTCNVAECEATTAPKRKRGRKRKQRN